MSKGVVTLFKELVVPYIMDTAFQRDKNKIATTFESIQALALTSIDKIIKNANVEQDSDILETASRFIVDRLEKMVEMTKKAVSLDPCLISELKPHCEYYMTPIVQMFTEAQANVFQKAFPSALKTSWIPMHGSVYIYHPYYDGMTLRRFCMHVSTGAYEMKDRLAELMKNKVHNFLAYTTWIETYNKGTWDGMPSDVSKQKIQSGAWKVIESALIMDRYHTIAFVESMKLKESNWNLFTHNCQDMSKVLMEYLTKGLVPSSYDANDIALMADSIFTRDNYDIENITRLKALFY